MFVKFKGNSIAYTVKAAKNHGISAKDFATLRRRLPRNYRQDVVDELESAHGRQVSPQYISMVVSGVRFDQQVLDILIVLANEYQARLTDIRLRMRGKQPAQ